MNTVTIYKIDVDEAFAAYECGTYFSLSPWGEDTVYYKGDDDGGRRYLLPDGYHVAKTAIGNKAVYDAAGNHHEILVHSSGLPQLVSGVPKMPVLKVAESHA